MAASQYTEAQELANARYAHRKQIQSEMLEKLRDPSIPLEQAQWWFDRFVTAYRAELAAHEAAKAKP